MNVKDWGNSDFSNVNVTSLEQSRIISLLGVKGQDKVKFDGLFQNKEYNKLYQLLRGYVFVAERAGNDRDITARREALNIFIGAIKREYSNVLGVDANSLDMQTISEALKMKAQYYNQKKNTTDYVRQCEAALVLAKMIGGDEEVINQIIEEGKKSVKNSWHSMDAKDLSDIDVQLFDDKKLSEQIDYFSKYIEAVVSMPADLMEKIKNYLKRLENEQERRKKKKDVSFDYFNMDVRDLANIDFESLTSMSDEELENLLIVVNNKIGEVNVPYSNIHFSSEEEYERVSDNLFKLYSAIKNEIMNKKNQDKNDGKQSSEVIDDGKGETDSSNNDDNNDDKDNEDDKDKAGGKQLPGVIDDGKDDLDSSNNDDNEDDKDKDGGKQLPGVIDDGKQLPGVIDNGGDREEPDVPEQESPEKEEEKGIKVVASRAWNWVKKNKKKILIALGLAAVAVSVVVLFNQLLPAIVAMQEASNVSTLCTSMLSNSSMWHTAIASEQVALHGANTALASQIQAIVGKKAVYDTATGIWHIGGTELSKFAATAAANAVSANAKVSALSGVAKGFGLGGLGSIAAGVLLNNHSNKYKEINAVIKGYNKAVKEELFDETLGVSLSEMINEILSSEELSTNERITLMNKIKKIAKKAGVNLSQNDSMSILEDESHGRGGR